MRFTKRRRFYKAAIIALIAPWFFLGCGNKPGILKDLLDSPEHHAMTGFKLMEKRYLEDARREFDLALADNPKYSLAHRGLGLLYGIRGDLGAAFRSMNRARDCAVTKEESALAYVGFMRLYTIQNEKGWLRKVEENFCEASILIKEFSEAYYEMGIAYKQAKRLPESEEAFKRVLEINKGLVAEANEELKSLKKLQQE